VEAVAPAPTSRETRNELDRLLEGLTLVLDQVRFAVDDAQTVDAWRQVQVYGWQLNQVVPTVDVHAA